MIIFFFWVKKSGRLFVAFDERWFFHLSMLIHHLSIMIACGYFVSRMVKVFESVVGKHGECRSLACWCYELATMMHPEMFERKTEKNGLVRNIISFSLSMLCVAFSR